MKDIAILSPINKQAAMMLAKAPWWAYPPEDSKKEIIKAFERVSVDKLVDVTQEPPKETKDRRGEVLFWADGRKAVIVGFCHKDRQTMFRSEEAMIKRSEEHGRYKGDNFNSSKRLFETRSANVWWSLSEGDFYPIKWKAPSCRNWRTQEEMDRGNAPKKMKWDINPAK
jgi:hypothetical protein